MSDLLQSRDFILLIVGAGISLATSTVIMFIQDFVSHLLKNKGKINIYLRFVYSIMNEKGVGFYNNSYGGMFFSIPLWIEIHNTKGIKQIVRNVSLKLYKNDKYIDEMTQITNTVKFGKGDYYYGNDGAYSFLMGDNEIQRFDLQYMYKKQNEGVNKTFDEVRISFFDNNDNEKEFTLIKIDKCWSTENDYNIDYKKWIKIS